MTAIGGHQEPHRHGAHAHGGGDVHLTEADWAAYAAQTERQGEVFIQFLVDTIDWIDDVRGSDAQPVRRVLDVGSGPGVAACQLALAYPQARVTAVDSSAAMLAAARRASRLGLAGRVDTCLAELPAGVERAEDVERLGGADLIWASMSLHHVGDEVGALRALRGLLRPSGLIAVAEMAGATQVLPDDLDLGRPGFLERLAAAGAAWFADMRHGLPGSVESGDLPSMLVAAGFDVVGQRVAHQMLDAPLSDEARRVAHDELLRTRAQLGERLDADDRRTLDILCDENDRRGAQHLAGLFMASSREIVISRPAR